MQGIFFLKGEGWGWLKREGWLNKFLLLRRGDLLEGGGLFERGGLIDDLRYYPYIMQIVTVPLFIE